MIAWGPIISAVGSVAMSAMSSKSSPQQTSSAMMKQDDDLTSRLIEKPPKLEKPGKAEQGDWLHVLSQSWAKYEAAAKRRNPDVEDVYKDLLARSKQQMSDRIEYRQFEVEA
jgi:hypothetical protein